MKKTNPPPWINRLLNKCLNETLWENIEGDLHEIFQEDLLNHGPFKARIRYLINGLAFLRFNRLRKDTHFKAGSPVDLFANYFKISSRDLLRNKSFAMINLIGLVTAFTTCLFILQYFLHEISFDAFHDHPDRIYRVVNDRYQNGNLVQHSTITYPRVGPALVEELPEVTACTRMTVGGRDYLQRDGSVFMVTDYLWADGHFLNFFNFPLIYGDKNTALDEPNEVVLAADYAERLLKNGENLSDLIGQSIDVFGGFHCKISGILQTLPIQSHLKFDLLISFQSMVERSGRATENSWDWSDFYHYVRLQDGIKPIELEDKLTNFSEKYFKNKNVSGGEEKFWLQPLLEAHLNSEFEYEIGETSNGRMVWLMLAIALFIMIIAWINFINLSSSRAIEKAKEIGIMKTLGASKIHLFYRCFFDSLLINGIAMITSLVLVYSFQSVYNDLINLPLDMKILYQFKIWQIPFPLWLFGILFFCFIIISLYPTYTLFKLNFSQLKPNGSFSIWFKKALVVFQFALGISLITSSVTIYQQVNFMRNQELGMDMENTVVFYGPGLTNSDSTFIAGIAGFKHELLKLPGVASVTASNRVFSMQMSRNFQIAVEGAPALTALTSNTLSIDHDFINNFNIQLLAGRVFTVNDHHSDWRKVNKILINRASLSLYQFKNPREAVGKKLIINNRKWEIVGVVEDFHQRTMHSPLEPILFLPFYENSQFYSIKMKESYQQADIDQVAAVYQTWYPGNYVDYFYLPGFYDRHYANDDQLKNLAQVFTAMAMLIAIMGLYGLILITVSKKMKEIAIRKVLGANLIHLLYILGKDFIILALIASLASLPVTYHIMSEWLQHYEYRINVQWLNWLLAASILIAISIATIFIQAKRVDRSDPIDSLKCE